MLLTTPLPTPPSRLCRRALPAQLRHYCHPTTTIAPQKTRVERGGITCSSTLCQRGSRGHRPASVRTMTIIGQTAETISELLTSAASVIKVAHRTGWVHPLIPASLQLLPCVRTETHTHNTRGKARSDPPLATIWSPGHSLCHAVTIGGSG